MKLRQTIIYMLLLASCSSNQPNDQVLTDDDDFKKDSVMLQPKASLKKTFYPELNHFNRSKFPHKNLTEFRGLIQPLDSYPSFQDSIQDEYEINAYYSDQTYCEEFDVFVIVNFEGGDCGPMLHLKTTDKGDSLISSIELTIDCGWENGSYSSFTTFDNDSTFVVYYSYRDKAIDSTGQYLNEWNEGERISKYKISNATGEIIKIDEEEIKKEK